LYSYSHHCCWCWFLPEVDEAEEADAERKGEGVQPAQENGAQQDDSSSDDDSDKVDSDIEGAEKSGAEEDCGMHNTCKEMLFEFTGWEDIDIEEVIEYIANSWNS
jgi:hypothetical protein